MASPLTGIVRMGMIKRLPSLTPAEFYEHWRGPHGQLATKIPNLRRYHQNHAIASLPFGGIPDRWRLDGLSELWFDDIDTMVRSIASPDYAGLARDTPTVMTMPGLIAGPQERVTGDLSLTALPDKAMVVVGRRPDLDPESFRAGWRDLTERLATGAAVATITFVTHRESEPGRSVGHDRLPVDAVTELWFRSGDDLRRAFSPSLAGGVEAELAGLVADATAFVAKTHVIVA